ncbi:unnamed protein product [Litomosoides sigmodontis]|uniref:Uncharacterized protein n=1 Tax=Litomosoides sigmodontis TaxID=42156 RepID=A0A3P6SBJ5_LITSI|nr:unnamed protein product [Litomosoides sigmodontis]
MEKKSTKESWYSFYLQNFHHRLTKQELQLIFAVSHHEDVPEYALIDVTRKQLSDGTTHLLFDAWDQKFHVDLKRNLKLLSPHLVRSLEATPMTGLNATFNCSPSPISRFPARFLRCAEACVGLAAPAKKYALEARNMKLRCLPPPIRESTVTVLQFVKRSEWLCGASLPAAWS